MKVSPFQRACIRTAEPSRPLRQRSQPRPRPRTNSGPSSARLRWAIANTAALRITAPAPPSRRPATGSSTPRKRTSSNRGHHQGGEGETGERQGIGAGQHQLQQWIAAARVAPEAVDGPAGGRHHRQHHQQADEGTAEGGLGRSPVPLQPAPHWSGGPARQHHGQQQQRRRHQGGVEHQHLKALAEGPRSFQALQGELERWLHHDRDDDLPQHHESASDQQGHIDGAQGWTQQRRRGGEPLAPGQPALPQHQGDSRQQKQGRQDGHRQEPHQQPQGALLRRAGPRVPRQLFADQLLHDQWRRPGGEQLLPPLGIHGPPVQQRIDQGTPHGVHLGRQLLQFDGINPSRRISLRALQQGQFKAAQGQRRFIGGLQLPLQFFDQVLTWGVPGQDRPQALRDGLARQGRQLELAQAEGIHHRRPLQAVDQPCHPQQGAEGQAEQGEKALPARGEAGGPDREGVPFNRTTSAARAADSVVPQAPCPWPRPAPIRWPGLRHKHLAPSHRAGPPWAEQLQPGAPHPGP